MKLFIKFHFLIAICLTIISCSKEKGLKNDLEGTWEIRNVQGILRPPGGVNYPAGNGSVIIFEGSNYKEVNNTYINKNLSFSIVKDNVTLNGVKLKYKIEFTERFQEHPYFTISGNTLKLYFGDLSSDGALFTYERVR